MRSHEKYTLLTAFPDRLRLPQTLQRPAEAIKLSSQHFTTRGVSYHFPSNTKFDMADEHEHPATSRPLHSTDSFAKIFQCIRDVTRTSWTQTHLSTLPETMAHSTTQKQQAKHASGTTPSDSLTYTVHRMHTSIKTRIQFRSCRPENGRISKKQQQQTPAALPPTTTSAPASRHPSNVFLHPVHPTLNTRGPRTETMDSLVNARNLCKK